MALNNIRYTFDSTGTDPNNLVVDEYFTLPATINDTTAAVPTHGCFYGDSLTIVNAHSGTILERSVDYEVALAHSGLMVKTGLEIYEAIIINTPTTTPTHLQMTYQCVGGNYQGTSESILKILMGVYNNTAKTNYDLLVNKPTEFPPTRHTHTLNTLRGFGPATYMLDRISRAVKLSHAPVIEDLEKAIKLTSDEIINLRAEFTAMKIKSYTG